jgi:hypothetical protein
MSDHLRETHGGAPAIRRLLAVAALSATAFGALAGCGGSSSDKPAYCSDRSNLKDSVSGLTGVDLKSGGVSALQSQLQKVASDARALAASAKSDFPDETSAITSSVSKLSTALAALSSSPSPQQLLAVASDVSGVTSAFKSFSSATSSDCQ